MRAYSKILSSPRQPEDGQHRLKHVVVHYIRSLNTPHVTVVFYYIPFSKFHTHDGDDTSRGMNCLCGPVMYPTDLLMYSIDT